MATDKKSRTKARVAVKGKGTKKRDPIPTVTVPVATSSTSSARGLRTPRGGGWGRTPKRLGTSPATSRASRKSSRKRKPVDTQYGEVPASMAPPEMPDTRPTRPAPPAKPRIVDVQTADTTAPAPAPAPVQVQEPAQAVQTAPRSVAPPRTTPLDANDRLVQGAQCTWIGYLSEAPDDPTQERPVCPRCGGNLITAADEKTIQLGFEAFEFGAYNSINPPPRPHPGYRGMMEWMRKQPTCWTTIEAVAEAYEAATGNKVDPTR